jgi:hypothetical protein
MYIDSFFYHKLNMDELKQQIGQILFTVNAMNITVNAMNLSIANLNQDIVGTNRAMSKSADK